MSHEEWVNTCEHGDHPAPEGKRFCSLNCQVCEETPQPDGDGCANVCGNRNDGTFCARCKTDLVEATWIDEGYGKTPFCADCAKTAQAVNLKTLLERLLWNAGFSVVQIQTIIKTMDSVCPYCRDATTECQCWNDE